MTDFETHPRGTAEELRLLRALVGEIKQVMDQFGQVIPHNVVIAYNKLSGYYIKQIHNEDMK
jgi:hypothetical protein